MPPDSDPTHDPHGPWHPTPRAIYRDPPRDGWHATKVNTEWDGAADNACCVTLGPIIQPASFQELEFFLSTEGQGKRRFSQIFRGEKRCPAPLGVAGSGQDGTARHNSTKMESHEAGTMSRFAGACGQVYRNAGKRLHGFKRKRKISHRTGCLLVLVGMSCGPGQ